MSLIALVQSGKWSEVDEALQISYPYISRVGGRYLSDEHLVEHGGSIETICYEALCKEIYANLVQRVFFSTSDITDLSSDQKHAALRVIEKLAAFQIELDARLVHVSHFAFLATYCFDLIDQSDERLFFLRLDAVQRLVEHSLKSEEFARNMRWLFHNVGRVSLV